MQTHKMNPGLRDAMSTANKVGKALSPYFPMVVRLLLVSTFIEDGCRVLLELQHQVHFLRSEYHIPGFIATLMLLTNILVSFVAVAVILARKRLARGKYESHAAYVLIACVLYQQLLYGRHSPIASGNVGFLVRNLCLSGAILLVSCQARMASGRSALPLGILDSGRTNVDKKTTVAYMQLASRILLVLLALEFIVTLGTWGSLLTLPVVGAVLVGFKLEISGSILLMLYLLHNVKNSAFWKASHTVYMSQIMQYEFFQTLSIMGGLLMLILTGPGAYSVDEMRGRKAF